ncbi:hypothetical protein ONZ51_g11989 [Trametes cubensis]|uniref:Alkaline phosphatase D n=1 Tax=Trametes cubensis TaxID=1111947 RepID=A0AAD7TGI2_9APHY|nr:hypothetical protein ONZ51_g11989 [Trametes cubensis]
MLSVLFVTAALGAILSGATELFDRNLAYSSPFANAPHLSHNTRSLKARHVAFAKRQSQLDDTQSSNGFTDEHYPTFYGGDFSASPWIYNGGINFTHSVASGDPFDDSVLLWTRAVPIGSSLPDQSIPVCVSFKIFNNERLSGRPVDSGEAFTSYDVDFTLKVEAKNLKPDTSYWFQFADCTNPKTTSPIGATRTISSPNTVLAIKTAISTRMAWLLITHPQISSFTSAITFMNLWAMVGNVGYGSAKIGRKTLGRELATIADYRLRLNQYRTDVSLLDAHVKAPWITVCFSPSGACFTDRKLAAVRAYHEWMPIRQVDPDDKLRIWRNFQIGKLLDLTMLDTRQYDRDITDLYYNTECKSYTDLEIVPTHHQVVTVIDSIADEESRSLMGSEQENWFFDTLSASRERGAIWRIVGQQIVFTQLNESGFDVDAWDGYRANRERVLNHLYNEKISNTIILSGDSHANWVSDLAHPDDTTTYDPLTGKGAIGVEFAGTAVTSSSPFGAGIQPVAADKISQVFVQINEDLQWSEGSYRGFFTLTLNTTNAVATYYAMRNISSANLDAFASATFVVEAGANKLARPVAGGTVQAGVLKVQG